MKVENFKAERRLKWRIEKVSRGKIEENPETECYFFLRIADINEYFGCRLFYSSRTASFDLYLDNVGLREAFHEDAIRVRNQFSFNASIKLGKIEKKMNGIFSEGNNQIQFNEIATLDEFMELADESESVTLIIELALERKVEISTLPITLREFDPAKNSDFYVKCSDKVTIPCRRYTLEMASPWFRNTFKKAKDSCILDSIDSKKFKEILRYIYTGEYAANTDDKFKMEMIFAADMFGLSKFGDGLAAMMKENFTMERVFAIHEMDKLYRDNGVPVLSKKPFAKKVFQRSISFIVEDFGLHMRDDVEELGIDVFDALQASSYNIAISTECGELEETFGLDF